MKAKHFANTEIHDYYSDFGIFIQNSSDAISHLNTYAHGVHCIGILNSKPPRIIINYYHLEKIGVDAETYKLKPTPHHIGSYKATHDGPNPWELICEHEIVIHYPEVCLVRELHQYGNGAVRKAVLDFAKTHKYWDVKSMPFDDATWLMANILGKNEE